MNSYEMLVKGTVEAGKAVDAIKPGDILVYRSRVAHAWIRIYINIGPNKYYRIPETPDNNYCELLTSWIVRNLMFGCIKILSA